MAFYRWQQQFNSSIGRDSWEYMEVVGVMSPEDLSEFRHEKAREYNWSEQYRGCVIEGPIPLADVPAEWFKGKIKSFEEGIKWREKALVEYRGYLAEREK